MVLRPPHDSLDGSSSALAQSVTRLRAQPEVLSASDPVAPGAPALSADGEIGYESLHVGVDPKTLGPGFYARAQAAMAPVRRKGIEVEYGGSVDQLTRPSPNDKRSELVGFAVALVVLLVGIASVLGAVVPLLATLVSVLLGVSILGIVASVVTFGTASPTLALTIGLGVGIDDALFLATRFRQRLMDGAEPVDAAAATVATSGHAIVVAATTVCVALLGLYGSGLTFIGQLGRAAIFGVATAVAGAVTLVPAGLALVGRHIDRVALGRPVAEIGAAQDGWHRYATFVGRRPGALLAGGLTLLVVLAIPLVSMRLGHVGDGADPLSYTDKRAYDLISSGFGPGANGPLTVVVGLGGSARSPGAIASRLADAISRVPDVAHVGSLAETPDHALLVGTVVPASGPQAASTTTLFDRLVRTTPPSRAPSPGPARTATSRARRRARCSSRRRLRAGCRSSSRSSSRRRSCSS